MIVLKRCYLVEFMPQKPLSTGPGSIRKDQRVLVLICARTVFILEGHFKGVPSHPVFVEKASNEVQLFVLVCVYVYL
jgi:hypothetical protein